jgi:predicted nucleic acid-binding protein
LSLVIDASVTLAWCLGDEKSEYADGVLQRLSLDSAMVPSVWPIEVANGLIVAERRGRLTASEIPRVDQLLSVLSIRVAEAALSYALGPILTVARTHNLTAYDACYLELAMREGLPLASLDDRLRAAAALADVPLA